MSKDKYKKFKITIPAEWEEKLEQIAQENYISKKTIVYQALAQYFEKNRSYSSLNNRLKEIEVQLNNIKQTLSFLDLQNHEITALNNRLTILEKTLGKNLLEVVSNQSFTPAIEDDDDWVDEPDEILTDFLP